MSSTSPRLTTEEESRQVAEDSREQEWQGRGFLRELFLGQFSVDLVHPFPLAGKDRPEFSEFYNKLRDFLVREVDSVAIDETGEYPEPVVNGLRKLGAFGMKIPLEYGGLGFTVSEYCKVMEMIGSYDGNITALLSAHQSIGVPQPLKLFGTPEQKEKYLPRCAAGAISAFALTEPHAGSDPASLTTTATRDGDFFVLNGEKLWCTNGTLAELLVVMARHPETNRISAFVVEVSSPGVKIEHRCRFMGLKALANGVVSFTDVRVPADNVIGGEGKGLKIALITLNTGRLTLPAACAGIAKQCLETVRGWSEARHQWGVPIWKHEAVSHEIGDMAATTFAMDSIAKLASQMADRGGYDIRLEAAAAKEWNTVRAWELIDRTLQMRGGRGYETERSLADRGETPIPVERTMRDCRINLIFEGSSEIMHLFMAREAVDKHLQVAGAMIDKNNGFSEKAAAIPGIISHYAVWYPPLWLKGLQSWSNFQDWGRLGKHMRFIERRARKLARESFHGMALYQAQMERKQGFLFRCVDIVMELFAMAATLSHARYLKDHNLPEAERAMDLADLFCMQAERRVKDSFRALWRNDDSALNKVAAQVMKGDHAWLGEGRLDMGFTPESYKAKAFNTPAAPKVTAKAS